ncbi:hypothetical protein DVH24_039691 [Malus domestica]|uniref:Uncharacterized protein n=1 Tax=Malus domestica TaxID=3750 RepID=A0A498I3F4_MALDO|nr:hypothetical protein DVH24_039691 [Malus domestica]
MALLALVFEQLQKSVFLLSLLVLSAFILFSFTRSSSTGDEKRKLKLPPSPPRLPLIGNLHQLGTFPHLSLHALSKKYGDLMLVHFGKVPTLIVSSAEMAKEVMKTQDIAFCSRPKATAPGILFYDAHDVAFAPYGEYWRQVRKICVLELLSLKRVSQFQYARVEEVSELVGKIRKASSLNGGGPIVLSDLLVATSNNIICRCILGQKFEGEENKWFGDVAKDLMCQLMSFSFTDYFGPRMSWLDRARGHIKHLTSIWSEFDKFFDKLIAEHKEAEKEGKPRKKDFVDILLQVQKDGNDFELKSDHLKALLQRDPEVWDRSEEFIPERFEDSPIDFKGQDFQLIPFGAGRRGARALPLGSFGRTVPSTSGSALREALDMTEVYWLTVRKKAPLILVPVPDSP